jgi:hypothetical protein
MNHTPPVAVVTPMALREAPIGVFDSGVGGLTVLRALAERLPGERFLYLGDTARLPYGTKTADTVIRYSVQCAGRLVERGVKALVVACNTATTWALPSLAAAGAALGVPVLGVIEPGVERALAVTRNRYVAVIGTEGTGHTFPGPSRPFGMVQPGPDNADTGWDYTSGYQYRAPRIIGFSQTRASGTGQIQR